jgi:hypothetical protein
MFAAKSLPGIDYLANCRGAEFTAGGWEYRRQLAELGSELCHTNSSEWNMSQLYWSSHEPPPKNPRLLFRFHAMEAVLLAALLTTL